MTEEPKSPLREIIQPFIDLVHAPRALWGINLAYVIEGMVYFGMLGYLTIYCSDYVFQGIDGANEAAHHMVMVLTAGITIAMFFLGFVADKRGVRFALIVAFLFMLAGRVIWSGAPNLFGLAPVRPGVFVGDELQLHVTELGTRYGNKTITKATVVANKEDSIDVDRELKLDLAQGEGTAPTEGHESKLVQLGRVELIDGEDEEWEVRYGTKPTTARMFIRGAQDLGLRAGAKVSVSRAYVTRTEENASTEKPGGRPMLRPGATISLREARIAKWGDTGDEVVIEANWPEDVAAINTSGCREPAAQFLIRSQWISDITAIDTMPVDLSDREGVEPSALPESFPVQLGEALLLKKNAGEWEIEYGGKPVRARLVLNHRSGDGRSEDLLPDLAYGVGVVPAKHMLHQSVQVSKASIVSHTGESWLLQYGSGAVTVPLLIQSPTGPALCDGAIVSLRRAVVVDGKSTRQEVALRARWPEDFASINTFACTESPYRSIVTAEERDLKATSRSPIANEGQALSKAKPGTIAALREMDDGAVDVLLSNVYVTYVRGGGYCIQADRDGPGIFVFTDPFGSPLQIMTLAGMLFVVIGYGMYQPAAYAGVRKFTTPKTAAMGFAMLYALMNLGGWLPTFAFLLRDDHYLGLGIPGVNWVYTAFTLIALVATIGILSRSTVAEATQAAANETARIKAKESRAAEPSQLAGTRGESTQVDQSQRSRIGRHMWFFWVAATALFLFKDEAPWYYTWGEASWRWIVAAIIFVVPAFFATVPRARVWLAKHPLQDAKFAFFIFALIPVQTLFTYNWLVLPPYIKRAFEGWIGEYFEIAANSNPILIFIAVPIITAITQKAKVYNMMIIGTLVMAAPAFLLVLGPHWWTLFGYILIMTIGEAMWQPRFLQYAAEIAPEGRTGEYMGVAQLPWFLTKVLVPLLYSGRMMDRFCPAEGPKNTETMWFIFACIAMTSFILLILAKGWIGKDFKAKAD